MKRIGNMLLGLSLAFGTTVVFGQAPAQTDQPKTEKKINKTKNATSSDKGKGKAKGGSKNEKRKAEQPKAQ